MGIQTRLYLVCDECSKEYKSMRCTVDKNFAKFGKNLCQSCTRKGSRNPFYGSTFSDDKKAEFSAIRKEYYADDVGKSRREAQSKRFSGSLNPMYKGAGLRSNYTWRNKTAREKTLVRDNNTCTSCGATLTPKELVAHHLNSCDVNTADRTNISNIVTLCIECHKKFHGLYGYGKNTRAQFVEFLGKGSETIEKGESHLVG